jgi:hypothetical protein
MVYISLVRAWYRAEEGKESIRLALFPRHNDEWHVDSNRRFGLVFFNQLINRDVFLNNRYIFDTIFFDRPSIIGQREEVA